MFGVKLDFVEVYTLFHFSFSSEHMIFGSSSATEAARQLEFFFPTSSSLRKNTAIMEDCTCCVIKPHAVAEGEMNC